VWSTGDKEISVDDCKQTVLPEALEKLKKSHPSVYNIVKDNDWKFMQNCGCACGCSPGFVGGTKNNINIHIEI
jgi:hypothetical protein